MHVFTFSPRPGTAAAGFKPVVEPKIIKERSRILRSLDAELGFQFRQQFIGQEDEILTETANGFCIGRSKRYFYVRFENFSNNFTRNQLIKVKLLQNTDKLMTAEPL